MSRLIILIACFSLLLTGCSVMTPYKSTFQCPAIKEGKCVSMKVAYEESLKSQGDQEKGSAEVKAKGKKEKQDKKEAKPSAEEDYRESLYRELAGLLKAPVTPVVNPPKILRALIVQYPDSEKLFMPRYVFIMVDKPSWVLNGSMVGE